MQQEHKIIRFQMNGSSFKASILQRILKKNKKIMTVNLTVFNKNMKYNLCTKSAY